MKKFLLVILLSAFLLPAYAKHVTGGEIIYDYVGSSADGSGRVYNITLRLFRDGQNCTGATNCADLPGSLRMGVYNNDNNALVGGFINVSQTSFVDNLPVISKPPCLTNEPIFKYEAGLYTFQITLPNNTRGYTVTYQTCCRINSIINGGAGAGATYAGEIPGNVADNSARFQTGISVICYNKPFKLDFSATDSDVADVLVYEFYNAYNGGAAADAGYSTPAGPPYGSIGYNNPFSGSNPFGTSATINASTGIISGVAPAAGNYIVAVNVKTFRNGVFVTSHRKDFIVTVAPCDFASSELKLTYTNCDNLDFNFKNENSSLLNLTFDWNFGDPGSGVNNTSTSEFPPHTFSAPGEYTIKLIVNKNTPCVDSTTAVVRAWPGFVPAFAPLTPKCKNTPIQFTDLTTTSYPPVNYWFWDFGVTTLTNDTSRSQNPTYTYTSAGTYNATFIVETVKGCRDTLYPIVEIVDKPVFIISNDTLICTVDTLQLRSNVNTGIVTWSPNYMINNVNSFNPLVSPDVTTTYTAFYQDPSGCTNTASVTVKVVNDVTLLAINDTTICRTDTAKLNLNTDALYFVWTPASVIVNPTVKNPSIFPTAPSTLFSVKASISNKCFKNKDITVKTVPYPIPIATSNAPICFGKDAQLNATGGSIYSWSPTIYLNNANIAGPIVQLPQRTTNYTVTVRDTLGCPKPVSKSVLVEVIKIIADAGPSDTSIVLGQPLNLLAIGSVNYLWSPDRWLSSTIIPNPVSNPENNITYTVVVSNNFGCIATDTINVKVFFLPPDVYVPSAFTPNKDGSNDNFKPIALGIKSLENFSVFNRWGQQLFNTTKIGAGWDGTLKGIKQDAGTYVWTIAATDYKNKKIVRKGSVILIR
jgi:gliding motility-associated-like protein